MLRLIRKIVSRLLNSISLEKWVVFGLLSDGKTVPDVWDEHRAMEILKACRESVDAVA
jgi:hypothetical protein